MKKFNIPWLSRNILDYYVMQAAKQEDQQVERWKLSVAREEVTEMKERIDVDFLLWCALCVYELFQFFGGAMTCQHRYL